MRRSTLLLLLATGCGPAAAAPREEAPKAPTPGAPVRPWLDTTGHSIVGFGLLRVVPPAGGGSFRVHYRETKTEYSSGDQYQLFVLPGDAYASKVNAFAGEFLALTRTDPAVADGYGDLTVTFRVAQESTVLVAYGPWTAPDAGRPPGDHPTFSLEVTSTEEKGAFEWIESEAGELITTNWTNRPEVKRGAPVRDPITDAGLFVEVRPMILYDGRMVSDADQAEIRAANPLSSDRPMPPDATEEEEDSHAVRRRSDHRIVMTRELAEKFRRVPIRWR